MPGLSGSIGRGVASAEFGEWFASLLGWLAAKLPPFDDRDVQSQISG